MTETNKNAKKYDAKISKNQEAKEHLLSLIKLKSKMTVGQMIDELGISRQALYKNYLSPLLEEGAISKFGRPPRVYYALNSESKSDLKKNDAQDAILSNYIQITPAGNILRGSEAFNFWCQKRDLSSGVYLDKYKQLQKSNLKFKGMSGAISASSKMKDTFGSDYSLEETAYVDFYADEVFGKTSLGQLVLYAKQSQNKKLFAEVLSLIEASINRFIKFNKIEAVCFVPPTVKREVQFMDFLKKNLAVGIPTIKLSKIVMDVATPQKTLSKLKDRIDNARKTIFIEGQVRQYKRILIIDDAVGSGASFNEVAKMLKNLNPDAKIYGMAIVGSKKGFDVISEA